MTVEELIDELKKCDQRKQVIVTNGSGIFYSDHEIDYVREHSGNTSKVYLVLEGNEI